MPLGFNTSLSVGVPNTPGPGKIKSFSDSYAPIFEEKNWVISGVTRDAGGVALASCAVELFNTATDAKEQAAVSDGGGNYSFVVDKTQRYYVVAYKAGAPDLSGTTINTLAGT